MSAEQGTWRDPGTGAQFAYRSWRPASVKALLVLVHGFGEHGGRYEVFASSLADRGIWVAAPDLPGHGRSGGRRGHIPYPAVCLQQFMTMTNTVFLPASGLARYAVFGHSFGGLLAILWAMQNPPALQRVVLQSPLLEVGFPIPWWKTAAARALAGWWPTATFSTRLDASALSHDPTVVQGYQTDPLVHHVMTAKTYCATLDAKARAFEGTAAVRRPVLLLTAGADRVVSLEATHRWFGRLAGEKEHVTFSDAYHELHHEAARDEVLRLVSGWVLGGQEAR